MHYSDPAFSRISAEFNAIIMDYDLTLDVSDRVDGLCLYSGDIQVTPPRPNYQSLVNWVVANKVSLLARLNNETD